MLMFTMHIAFALGLIALTLGLCLKKWCCCCKSNCETTGEKGGACGTSKCRCWCGMVIVILALLSLLCTVHTGYGYWKAGEFKMPAPMATEETIHMSVQ